MPNFSRLVFMPIPHFNIISMIGMGQKLEYLIWRKSIDGFFTGLEPDGDLITWSYTNGKMIYKNKNRSPAAAASPKCLEGYAVYRTDESDNTYCRDLYELADGTYQLLASKMPVDTELSKSKGCSHEIEAEFMR